VTREVIVPAHEGFSVIVDDYDHEQNKKPYRDPNWLPVIAWVIRRDERPRAITPLGECDDYEAIEFPDGSVIGRVDGEERRFFVDDDWQDALERSWATRP
jgi:hypothetical protein